MRLRYAAAASAWLAVCLCFGASPAFAQDSGAADVSAKDAVRAAYDAMVRAHDRFAKIAEQARDDESKRSFVTLLGESYARSQQKFTQVFLDSDWPSWAKGDDEEFVLFGLHRMGEAHWRSDPAKARMASEMIVASAPGSQYAESAAVNIPYSHANEEVDGSLERSLEAARSLAKHYRPATKVQMRLFEGDLLLALGRKDEALAAYGSAVELADAIPREDSEQRDLGDLAVLEAEVRLRMIGKAFPPLRPEEWVGRDAEGDDATSTGELELQPGRFTVVLTGSAACRGCARFLAAIDRERRARVEQPFDVVALQTHSRTVFVPKDAHDPAIGQELYGVERDAFSRYLKAIHDNLGLTFPIAIVDRGMLSRARASDEAHASVVLVDPYGSVEYASTSHRGLSVVRGVLRQHLGAVEYPEIDAGENDRVEATDVSKLDIEVKLGERDRQPLPEGPHFAAAFLETERAYRANPAGPALARAYSSALANFGRHREAAECLDAALEKAPDDLELVVERAWQLLELATRTSRNAWQPGLAHVQREEAGRWVERAVAAGKDDVSVVRLQVRWMLESRDVDPGKAKRLADALVKAHPDDARAHRALGDFWYSMAALDLEDRAAWAEVERVYGDVVRLDPEFASGWLRIGLARQWQGEDPARCLDAYVKAATLDPDVGAALERLVDVRLVPDAARRKEILDELQKEHPESGTLVFYRAIEIGRGGDVPGALALCDEFVAAAPTDPFRPYYRGRLRLLAGPEHLEGGVDDLCDAVRLCRGVLDRTVYDAVDYRAIRAAGLSPEQRDRIWSVLFHEFPGEINAPGNAEVWFRDTQGDYLRSLVWCLRALQADPEDPMAHNDIGITHAQRDSSVYDEAKAEAAYKRAIQAAKSKGVADPTKSLGYKNAVDNLVGLLWRQGRGEDLRAYAESELKHDPRVEDIMLLTSE